MALSKTQTVDKVELSNIGIIFVRTRTDIDEDGTIISSKYHRHTVEPRTKASGSWADTDISGEDAWVQSVAGGAWTNSIKTAFENHMDSLASA